VGGIARACGSFECEDLRVVRTETSMFWMRVMEYFADACLRPLQLPLPLPLSDCSPLVYPVRTLHRGGAAR
jgi:hypothetical protein